MTNKTNLKQNIDFLIREYHENTLLNFSIVEPPLLPDSWDKILLIGNVGMGKTELINSQNFKRAYEFFSLLQVTDLNDFDYIILFKNSNLVDNILCKDFCNLSNIEMYKYLIIKKKLH